MKKLYSIILTCFIAVAAIAQSNLEIQQEAGKVFLLHKVAPKENWYSIGRLYNISPKEIAPYNNTTMEKGLSIGQPLKIPLSAVNFLQSGQPAGDEVAVPVYHTVKEKEGLYRIGQLYNKVPVEQLRVWNGLASDEVSKNVRLVVGYLKVKKDLSSLAAGGKTKVGGAVDAAPQTKPAVKEPEPTVVKTEKKPDPVVVTEKKPVKTESAPPVTAAPPQKAEPQPVRTEPVAQPTASVNNGEGGAFGGIYNEQSRSGGNPETVNGAAAIFKSTSGWKDSKYYALMNKVLPGTIVKVINPANSRFVYAKVLGEIPPGRENEGLLIRISNAAASELSLDEGGKYDLQLSWARN